MRALSLLSLALGLASAQRTPVSQQTFDTLNRYAAFAAASYADRCATPPFGSRVLQYFSDPATDAQATLFQYDAARQLVVAFRGSSSPRDIDTDVFITPTALNATGTSCGSCNVAEGILQSWNGLSRPVIDAVNSAKTNGYSIILVGHSLGGAIAGIAASSLGALGNQLTVYTYGELRSGTPAFTDYLSRFVPASRYFRVTHANDGVPQIPPTIVGFQHHGIEYWQSAKTRNTPATVFQCTGLEPADCNQAQDQGNSPINGAHISYSDIVIGNSLNVVQCGATVP